MRLRILPVFISTSEGRRKGPSRARRRTFDEHKAKAPRRERGEGHPNEDEVVQRGRGRSTRARQGPSTMASMASMASVASMASRIDGVDWSLPPTHLDPEAPRMHSLIGYHGARCLPPWRYPGVARSPRVFWVGHSERTPPSPPDGSSGVPHNARRHKPGSVLRTRDNEGPSRWGGGGGGGGFHHSGHRAGGHCRSACPFNATGEARGRMQGQRQAAQEDPQPLLMDPVGPSLPYPQCNQDRQSVARIIGRTNLCAGRPNKFLWLCFASMAIVLMSLFMVRSHTHLIMMGLVGVFILLLCSIVTRAKAGLLEPGASESSPLPRPLVEVHRISPERISVDDGPSSPRRSETGSEPPPYHMALHLPEPEKSPSPSPSVIARPETPPPPYELSLGVP
ncbi:unnamed protein product [Darwinula stevensoni]|uniref:Uncharacterized protein n=1 Tax=Darwinula stevensoni TaxID=69355 RepID=A0A7R8XHL6_9CRUS|nr:unnamed protein product [Darwinula stevensoni]CAG0892668.1 unnamed protein product [Darwinula stevensoni]